MLCKHAHTVPALDDVSMVLLSMNQGGCELSGFAHSKLKEVC